MINILLIAEDEKMTSFYLKLMAEKILPDIKVLVADSGKDAFDIYMQEDVDIIITDNEMTPWTGIELAREIRKIDLLTPIYLVSGYDIEEKDLLLFNGYIKKPLDLNVFENFLKRI